MALPDQAQCAEIDAEMVAGGRRHRRSEAGVERCNTRPFFVAGRRRGKDGELGQPGGAVQRLRGPGMDFVVERQPGGMVGGAGHAAPVAIMRAARKPATEAIDVKITPQVMSSAIRLPGQRRSVAALVRSYVA